MNTQKPYVIRHTAFLCILCVYGFFFCLLQLFFCYFQHQLDPVHLIDLAGISVTIKRNDIRLRISAQKLADHALAGNMIRQAGRRYYLCRCAAAWPSRQSAASLRQPYCR